MLLRVVQRSRAFVLHVAVLSDLMQLRARSPWLTPLPPLPVPPLQRRNWSSKAATEAGATAETGAARQAVAAAGQAAVKKAPKYTYSSTEKFALALWHG
jgi:hypothetical protein